MWSDRRQPDPASPAVERARAAHAEFLDLLRRQTPRAWVVQTLIAANAIVYAWMVARGVDPMQPRALEMIAWGAGYGPLTTGGEWWRLLTSTFLHFGLIHLAFNMWVLWSLGPLVERILGHARFAVLYVVSGILASLTSLYWNPQAVGAGASGAVFGVAGGLLGVLVLRPREMPAGFILSLRRSLLEFVAYNVVLGMAVPNIGLAAHLGGLVAGFGCGLSLGRRGLFGSARNRRLRALETAALGFAVAAAAACLAPRGIPDSMRAVESFSAAEDASLETYNRAIERSRSGEISDAELGRIIEQEVLPPWRAASARLESLRGLPREARELVQRILNYAHRRQSAWELQVRGLQTGDAGALEEAAREHDRADQLARATEDL